MFKYISQNFFPLFLFAWAGFAFVSCGGDSSQFAGGVKPSSMGKIYQVNTLVSPEIFNSDVIDTFDYRYGRAYPILPQPEPYFDLRYYDANDLNATPLLRSLKCFIILADMSIDDELTRMVREDFRESIDFKDAGVKIGQDKWAREQLVVYIYGPDKASLIKEINRSYLTVSDRIVQYYQDMIRSTVYVQGQNRMIQDTIRQKFHVDMKIPADYVTSLEADSLIWLRQEIPEISRSIMISRFPYRDETQFTRDGIIKMRNRMGEYISSTILGSYMRVNATDLPMFIQSTEVDGHYAMQAEGIWEIVGDFLGGSFVSYAILDEKRSEIIFVDGFVYSPEKKKKLSMIYLDYILRQTEISD